MADLHAWLKTPLRHISGRSDMAMAIRSSLNHGNALTLICGTAVVPTVAADPSEPHLPVEISVVWRV